MFEIETLESLPGSGKTEVVIQEIINNKDKYNKIIWVSKTIDLLESTAKRFNEHKLYPELFHSKNRVEVAKDLVNYKAFHSNLYFIMVTHKTYFNCLSSLTNNDLVVIDEEIDIDFRSVTAKTEESKSLIENHISFSNFLDKEYTGTLSANETIDSDDFVNGGKVKSLFDLLARKDNTVLYNLKNTSDGMMFDYISIPTIDYISRNKKVLYIGYKVSECISSLIYKSLYNVTFKRSNLEKNLRFNKYNGHAKIHYIFKDCMGNTSLKKIPEPDLLNIKNLIEKTDMTNDCLYVFQDKDNGLSNLNLNLKNSCKLTARPEGLNKKEWMEKTKIILLANYYTTPSLNNFLFNLGIEVDIELSRHVPMLVQQLTRSKIRNNNCDIEIIVISQTTANQLSTIFESSKVVSIDPENDVKFEKKKTKTKVSEERKRKLKTINNRIGYLRKKDSLTTEEEQLLDTLNLQKISLKKG